MLVGCCCLASHSPIRKLVKNHRTSPYGISHGNHEALEGIKWSDEKIKFEATRDEPRKLIKGQKRLRSATSEKSQIPSWQAHDNARDGKLMILSWRGERYAASRMLNNKFPFAEGRRDRSHGIGRFRMDQRLLLLLFNSATMRVRSSELAVLTSCIAIRWICSVAIIFADMKSITNAIR